MASSKRLRQSNSSDSVSTPSGSVLRPANNRLEELTGYRKFVDFFPQPPDIDASLKKLRADLKEVPVRGRNGTVTDPYSKIEAEPTLSREDKDLIWKCLAIVRESFLSLESIPPGPNHLGGYQWNMNWKHTRSEIDQVLEAAKLLKLSPAETRDALLASIFSDSIKNRRNFITHNLDGAQGAAQALSYFLNPNKPEDMQSIERIVQAVREHQVTPPEFMARALVILICKKLGRPACSPWDRPFVAPPDEQSAALASIYTKVADPFNKDHLSPDCHTINFTDKERALLKSIGIDDWYVPHPDNSDSKIAHAVIAGDHSINYNHPEGFAKIALIRGPDTEAIFEDPTVHHSLDSAVSSFADSFRVIRPEVQSLAMAGLRRTKTAVERVTAIMRELFANVVPCGAARSSGIDAVSSAIERAHQRHPALFTVEAGKISPAAREYTERAVQRVGNILEEWFSQHGEIPFTPKEEGLLEPGSGKLPFWNTPLKYPDRDSHGNLNLSNLTELELRQFAFAEKIREIAVELLRGEQWIF